ncbi:MAG: phaR [Caulobacteraceae bacterium]|nr:phaR [Caulobacteraceae bacterium]
MADEKPVKPGTGKGAPGERVVIQKYANRRLYNKATSTYITLENLAEMVRKGVDFVVYDAKTNEDITRKVLTQIIFDEENRGQGQNLLPIQFLRQLISFYGDSMQAFLPSYLELSLDSFSRQQDQFRQQFASGQFGGLKPGGFLEDQVRQNMVMFDRAMKMFSPFSFAATGRTEPAAAPSEPPKAADEALDDLKKQMAAMQEQIERLAKQ